jgi:hypothetical protein
MLDTDKVPTMSKSPNKARLAANDGWLPGEFVENGEEDKPNADGWWPGSIIDDGWEPSSITEIDDEKRRAAEANEWLAAKLDPTVKRDTNKAECMRIFGISGRAYQFRVWPDARELVDLPRCARPGAKKQIKK